MKTKLLLLAMILVCGSCQKENVEPDKFKGYNLIGKSFDTSVAEITAYGATLSHIDTLNGIYNVYHCSDFECTLRQNNTISYVLTKYFNDYLSYDLIKQEINTINGLVITKETQCTTEWENDTYIFWLVQNIGVIYIVVADKPSL
jgi:hypothetical protein